jgi:putative endonuclease
MQTETKDEKEVSAPWYVYLIECDNGALYAGIAKDVDARFRQHAAGKGAKYTRANAPVRLVASKAYPDRGAASRAEYALKQLPRADKINFLSD